MRLGSSVTLSAGALLAIGLAGWVLVTCARRDGIATGKQLEHDVGTDRANAARAAGELEAEVRWRHVVTALKDSNTVLNQELDRQVPRAEAAAKIVTDHTGPTIATADAQAAVVELQKTIVLLKGVIAQDTVGIRSRDGEILRLTNSVRSYTDTVVPNLTRDRNKWRRRALVSMCGLGGTVGVGIRGADAVAGFTCRISLPHIPGL